MSDQRVPQLRTRTAERRPRRTGDSPSALGVKPDARLAQAFLTQAFVWMFVGLLVTAGVAFVVQCNERLAGSSPQGNFFLLFIAQLALVVAISWGDQQDQRHGRRWDCSSSTPRSLGITIGLIVSAYTSRLRRDGVPVAPRRCSVPRPSTATSPSARWRGSAASCSWALIGLLVAIVLNLFLASDAPDAGSSRSSAS